MLDDFFDQDETEGDDDKENGLTEKSSSTQAMKAFQTVRHRLRFIRKDPEEIFNFLNERGDYLEMDTIRYSIQKDISVYLVRK
ncbi:hypothetical protein AVEN_50691-1 [Araneus ventricosus]|uniref:Uncharacterized protein n=1 Tax=Araneus ventricosus TaxID=182803 RepID=A0A4Y2M2H7_ARAVE|nr:hypothetical protein AVEN_50691-1 [Araneus ventricosus]